jgi:hypothetical protein
MQYTESNRINSQAAAGRVATRLQHQRPRMPSMGGRFVIPAKQIEERIRLMSNHHAGNLGTEAKALCKAGGIASFVFIGYSLITMAILSVFGGLPGTASESFTFSDQSPAGFVTDGFVDGYFHPALLPHIPGIISRPERQGGCLVHDCADRRVCGSYPVAGNSFSILDDEPE